MCSVASFCTAAASPALETDTGLPAFANPPELRSRDGRLDVTMEARETKVALGGKTVAGATYNGVYAGPVLRLKPGDTLRFHLINHLAQATNVHFHGLGVSPQGHSDNSMHMVAAGDSWDYIVKIPKDHPPGVYWYHTHGHDFAERQLMGGLSGTLVIEGFQDQVPATRSLRERLFALKTFSASPGGRLNAMPKPVHGEIKSINGLVSSRIDIQPGQGAVRLTLDCHHLSAEKSLWGRGLCGQFRSSATASQPV